MLDRAAITEYHRLGGLNYRNLYSHCSAGRKPKTRASACLLSPWIADGHLHLVSSCGLSSVEAQSCVALVSTSPLCISTSVRLD